MSYAFRKSRSSAPVQVADLFGAPRQVPIFQRGAEICAIFGDLSEPDEPPPDEPAPAAVRAFIRNRIEETIRGYEFSGRFTQVEIRTIRALWQEGLSLRALARQDGVAAQAVQSRIEGNRKGQGGIRRKAPEFYRWWAFTNRSRRQRHVHRTQHRPSSKPNRQLAA